MMRFPALLLPLAALACTPPQSVPSDTLPTPAAADGGPTVGTIRVVGSAPVNVSVVLQPAEGGSIEVVGPLRDELRRLSGARVALRGPVEPAPDPLADRRIRVDDYEILSVDGEPVIAGTVEGREGEWVLLRTATGELVYLGGAAAELRPGQKVWVQGPRSVTVQSYGVIR